MKTIPDIDRFKATLDQHRALDPAMVRDLREDPIVRWTYPSNAIEGNTPTLQERSWSGFGHDARVSHDGGEFFHKETRHLRRICEAPGNTPAKPLNDAQLGGYFLSKRPATPLATISCAPGRVLYFGHQTTEWFSVNSRGSYAPRNGENDPRSRPPPPRNPEGVGQCTPRGHLAHPRNA